MQINIASPEFPVADSADITAYGNRPPIAEAGDDRTIVSKDQTQAVPIEGNCSDEDGDNLEYRWMEGSLVWLDWQPIGADVKAELNVASLPLLRLGEHVLTLQVRDTIVTSQDTMILTVDNSAPSVVPEGGGTYRINEPIVLNGKIADYDGDLIAYRWYIEGQGKDLVKLKVQTKAGGEPVDIPSYTINGSLAGGTYQIWLEADDGVNTPVKQSIGVFVNGDIDPPVITTRATPAMLWPPNHELVPVTITTVVSDNQNGPITLRAVVSCNEPPERDDQGNIIPDYTEPVINQATGVITLQLRSARQGSGTGRIYTITITAADQSGNESTAVVNICLRNSKFRRIMSF